MVAALNRGKRRRLIEINALVALTGIFLFVFENHGARHCGAFFPSHTREKL